MDKITLGSALRYAALPGIIPQIRALFGSGFGFITFSMALVFGAVGLLPRTHPYLRSENIGRFGISHTILEAWRNLVFDRKHLDQVILFFTVVLGVILMAAQILLFCFALTSQFAWAGVAANYAAFFVTPDPTQDVAHILMDRVFGIPNLYNSCVAQGIVCLNGTLPDGAFPAPYHIGLQTMLQFYSIGVAVIGIIIFLYYSVVIVVETAQTGVPFGRRFDKLWAPIRMVVAIGLLIPISYGLNGAQLLTLNVAKWGSAFATNGWVLFANTLTSSSVTITGQPASEMVATPRKPDAQPLISFFTIVGTCHRLYRDVAGVEIDAWLVRSSTGGATNAVRLLDTTWTQALAFYDNSNIMVVFGERSETRHNSEMGFVKPYCGKIVLPTVDLVQPGARSIQDSYYEQLIRRPWRNILHGTPAITTGVPNLPAPNNQPQDFFSNAVDRIAEMREGVNFPAARAPDQNALNAIRTRFESDITQYIQTAVTEQINNTGPWQAQLNALGWAGAGIWYNRIAELNGAMIEGISNLPTPAQMPIVMEEVSKAKMANSSNIPGPQLYEPRLTNGEAIQLPNGAQDLVIARVLWYAERVWGDDANPGSTSGTSAQRLSTKNALQDFVNFAFGTQGLYSMVENTNVHPLAQLVTLGKHLFNTALRNIAVSFGGSLAGFVEKNSPIPAEFITMITRAAGTFGNMTLVIGFVLYYIVPFMPFMYFFFQVGTWVKEVFEAMVGLPLWALAHLRIEEGGLPGPAGMNGYWLIFEIFLRPILLIFGLIGSIAIFAAQVQILNDIFSLVVMNVSGYNIADAQLAGPNTQGGFDRLLEYARSQIDTFFFTIMYAVIVYLLATSSFKLIYQVPNNILRWMGASVSAFEDSESSAPSSLISTTTMSLQTVTGNLSSLTSRFLMR